MYFYDSIQEKIKTGEKFNISVIAPFGYGKTTQLRYAFNKLGDYNKKAGIVPIYVDLKNIATGSIYSYISCMYSHVSGAEENDKLALLFQNDKEHNYILFIDNYEKSALENEQIMLQLNVLKSSPRCSMIIASDFDDVTMFKDFNKYVLKPLTKDKIDAYINAMITDKYKNAKIDFSSIENSTFDVINIPDNLVKFTAAARKKLLSRKIRFPQNIKTVSDLYDKFFIGFESSMSSSESRNGEKNKYAYFCEQALSCVKNKKSEFRLKEEATDVYGSAESFGVGKIIKKDKKNYFEFANASYLYYFASKCVVNNIKVLNTFICDLDFLKYLSNLITEDEIIGELDDSKITDSFNACISNKQLTANSYITANLVSLLHIIRGNLNDVDLSRLDLRYCNFIGKECKGTNFSHSLCTDECFAPVEPSDVCFFAISLDGSYIVSGNTQFINVRADSLPIVALRIKAGRNEQFRWVKAVSETTFEVCMGDSVEKYENLLSSVAHVGSTSAEGNEAPIITDCKFKSIYGATRCENENFALVESRADSVYGRAYLVFNKSTGEIASAYPIASHYEIEHIVQNEYGEIELLSPNICGEELVSLCFNPKRRNKLYKKKYPSLEGRKRVYSDSSVLLFDTNDIDSYLKRFETGFKLEKYGTEDVDNENSACISDAEFDISTYNGIKSLYWVFYFEVNSFTSENCIRLGNGNWNYEISCKDYFNCRLFGEKITLKNIPDSRFSIEFDRYNFLSQSYLAVGFLSCNVTKKDDNYYLMVYNDVYRLEYDEGNERLNYIHVKRYDLTYVPNYEKVIDSFNFNRAVTKLLDKWNKEKDIVVLSKSYDKYDWLYDNAKPIVNEELADIAEELGEKFVQFWAFYFTSYIALFLCYSEIEEVCKIPSTEVFVSDYKRYSRPCDNGITYYDGGCQVYLGEHNGEDIRSEYVRGGARDYFRNGVHHAVYPEQEGVNNNYKFYDIYSGTRWPAAVIDAHNLELFGAQASGIIGLSSDVKAIIGKYAACDTRKIKFDDE